MTLYAVVWSKRQTAVLLSVAPHPPLLLQAPWDSNPCCLPTLRPHSQPWNCQETSLLPKIHSSLAVVQLLALGCTCPDHTFFLLRTGWGIIHHFKCFGYRFPQHSPLQSEFWSLLRADLQLMLVLWRGLAMVKALHSWPPQKFRTLLCWDGFRNTGVSVMRSRKGRLLLEICLANWKETILGESEENSC